MHPYRRHGITFSLHLDPDGPVWFEARRDSDGAVLEFKPMANPHHTVESAVDAWLTYQLEEMFSHIEFEDCAACGSRFQQRPLTDDCTPRQMLAWRFDLCTPCAERLAVQNPWLERQQTHVCQDGTEDW